MKLLILKSKFLSSIFFSSCTHEIIPSIRKI
uniref:Uncharacterized protein n=1 Tax=Siphoviridae sp. ctKgQ2 TaxID=2827842 RepID=A0A8S5TMC0_9CAUD|nr:MAG TPA: hypothetical protein [Siphoviridae sp. ctKgQ2]